MTLEMSRYAVQARLAIGEKHKETGYPVKLDHFIITMPFDKANGFAPRHPALSQYLKEIYKTDRPKIIDIVLIDDHPDEVFYTNYMNYRGSTCCCKGDGTTAIRVGSDGNKFETVCDYDKCEFKFNTTNKGVINTCKPTGILSFVLVDAPLSGGIIKFSTHSRMTIEALNGFFREIYHFRKTLKLMKVRLRLKTVSVNVNGKPTNVYIVEGEVPFSLKEIMMGAGTAVGTIDDVRPKNFLDMKPVPPNKEKMKALDEMAQKEGYDGSDAPETVLTAEVLAADKSGSDDDINF
jgi:hypothetical protein